MKKILLIILLAIGCLPLAMNAQVFTVLDGTQLSVLAGTTLSADSIGFTPSADFSLTNNTLSKSSGVAHALPGFNVAINRVYQFSNTTDDFSGSVLMHYRDGAELNSVDESSLNLVVHNGTEWSIFTDVRRDGSANAVTEGAISSLPLNEISLGGCPTPPAPTSSDTSVCSGYSISLSATGVTGGTIGWYDAPTGGNYLGGGTSFTTGVLTADAIYYVQDSTCMVGPRRAVHVHVKQPSTSTSYYTFCSNVLPFSWNGLSITAPGTYVVHLTNAEQCDSAATLIFNVVQANFISFDTSICSSELPLTWKGHTFTASESYVTHLINSHGCDSVITVNVNVLVTTSSTTTVTACSNT